MLGIRIMAKKIKLLLIKWTRLLLILKLLLFPQNVLMLQRLFLLIRLSIQFFDLYIITPHKSSICL